MPELGLSAPAVARSGAASFAEALERLALLWVAALSLALLWRVMLRLTIGEVILIPIGLSCYSNALGLCIRYVDTIFSCICVFLPCRFPSSGTMVMAEQRGDGEDPCGGPGPSPAHPADVEGRLEQDLAVEGWTSVPCRAPSAVPAWTRFRARLRRLAAGARALWVRARDRKRPRPPYRQPF